jgi:hypothetical protein
VKKILYLMHMPWGWVKQRPHFLAEGLTRFFEVCVCTEKLYWPKSPLLKNRTLSDLAFRELFKLPHVDFHALHALNNRMVRCQLRHMLRECDYLWVTHPTFFARIQDIVPDRVKVVYDCMDDVLAFPAEMSDMGAREKTFLHEKGLVGRSNAVFVSSAHLKMQLVSRYGADGKMAVVNNALSPGEATRPPGGLQSRLPAGIEHIFKTDCLNISYLGTIAPWIDFDLILESLARFSAIRYIFFGPCDVPLPRHDRISHGGSVEHDLVFDIMGRSDALVMPFRVDDLVSSVNPVKLYEYSYSGTPSIAVRYDETLMFRDFVYLYDTGESYFELIRRLIDRDLPLKRSGQERRQFAIDNSWDTRVSAVADLMLKI